MLAEAHPVVVRRVGVVRPRSCACIPGCGAFRSECFLPAVSQPDRDVVAVAAQDRVVARAAVKLVAVAVAVGLEPERDLADVADAVAVDVRLAGVEGQRAVVERVEHAVAVFVFAGVELAVVVLVFSLAFAVVDATADEVRDIQQRFHEETVDA